MNITLISAINRIRTKWHRIISTSFNDKYLIYTNIGISLALSGVGDILEQHYEILTKDLSEWDPLRTRNMCVSGIASGIICHHWYKFLDQKLPGYTIRIVMKKIVLDQLICSPMYISSMFFSVGYLEGKNTKEIIREIREKAWLLYTAEWIVWPPAQFINFYFLPTRFRVLYDNTISLGYDVYTSYVKHKNSDQKTSPKD